MRNTRKSGQILRSKKRPHPTLRSGRASRTNSNTSHQIQAPVIEASRDSEKGLGSQYHYLCTIGSRATAACGAGVPAGGVIPHLEEPDSANVIVRTASMPNMSVV